MHTMFTRVPARMRRALTGAISTVLLVAAFAPATALAGGATPARGIQHAFGTCGDGQGYLMTGDLEGCWYVDTFDVKPMPVQGVLLATGEEHFDGCYRGVCGTFWTHYTYTARFDGATEILGRCHHPIWKGVGGFAGATGELSFKDVIVDPPYYPYWGNIRLGSGATVAAPSTRTASANGAGIDTRTGPC